MVNEYFEFQNYMDQEFFQYFSKIINFNVFLSAFNSRNFEQKMRLKFVNNFRNTALNICNTQFRKDKPKISSKNFFKGFFILKILC